MTKKVILTGLRANNDLHIGNYFGGLLPLIDMAKNHAEEFQINLFVPDLHSFTTPIDHSQLQGQIMHNLKLFVAAGLPLGHESVHIYRQSYIPAHSELTVILNSFTGMGQMGRMTQYKDKSPKLGDDHISVGLFDYPVLMAADILLYNASYVPVGDDQSQHLEFARDIAERMNAKFAQELFIVPEPVRKQHEFFGNDQGLRIKDLVDPSKKMSKSDASDKGIIFLGDDPAAAAKKIMSATTDNVGAVHLDYENQPGISNLLQTLALLKNRSLDEVAKQYDGMTEYGTFKKEVAEAVQTFLTDFQSRLAMVNEDKLLSVITASEAKMNEVANATLLKVHQAVGLR
ncbi:MAG: tryptophanyl-tRNA synthetase [Patescibacteria group bacterium]|nr:tryptophan--tRNA ligase [Candidatus Saccharibacteria bacterium]MDQ5963466.1 tryptophanyl-tRNA synthetase [Patescibacteria group bacterium]